MRRQKHVIGNWKMHGSQALLKQFLPALQGKLPATVSAGLCVPASYLAACSALASDTELLVGAQDVSEHESGAYTGEIAAPMVADCGARLAIVGHSERRQYHGETGAQVGRKAEAALAAGLVPIVCVGETLEQRRSGLAETIVLKQIDEAFDELTFDRAAEVMIAYEPVWAIGTGEVATTAEAQAMHAAIRQRMTERNGEIGAAVAILYGGSVKPDNAVALFAAKDIDGGLVGGASLKANDFLAICDAAAL